MAEPDARLGSTESANHAMSNMNQAIDSMKNNLSNSVNMQINLLNDYQKRKAAREEANADRQNQVNIKNAEMDNQKQIHAMQNATTLQRQTQEDAAAADRQKRDLIFKANSQILSYLQATGQNAKDGLKWTKDKDGKDVLDTNNIDGVEFLILNDKNASKYPSYTEGGSRTRVAKLDE